MCAKSIIAESLSYLSEFDPYKVHIYHWVVNLSELTPLRLHIKFDIFQN